MAPIDELSLIEDILFEINLMFNLKDDLEEVLDTMVEIYGVENLKEIYQAMEIWTS